MIPNHLQHPQIIFPQHPDGTNLRAEVPPFIPRSSGDGGPHSLPSYVTTCYPFVQEQQDNRNNFLLQQPHSNNNNNPNRMTPPYNPSYFPLGFTVPPPQLGNTIGVIPSNFPQASNMFTGNLADSNLVSAVYGDQRSTLFPNYALNNKSEEGPQNYSGRKILRKNVGVQKEVESNNEKDNNEENPVMVDSSQQTDFPLSIACKSLTDRPSPLRKSSKSRRRRAVMQAANGVHDSSSDHADVDSDSGYYSPKHRFPRKVSGGTSMTELTREQSLAHQQPGSSQTNNTNLQHLLYIQHNNTMPPPTLLYQLHPQSPSNPYMGALSPHVTPPPQGLLSGPSLLISPPPTPMLGTLNSRNPGVIKPPSPMQMQSNMVWGASQFYPNNYAPKILQPKQQLQYSNNHGMYKNYKVNRNKQYYSRSDNNGSGDGFNNNKNYQDRRMEQYGNNMNQHQQMPLMLSDAQEFPGLGGSGLVQPQSGINSALSYSNVVMGRTKPQGVESAEEKNALKNRKRRKKAERASKAADEEYAEISKEHENIKKALKKTAANKNRPKAPMLDLGEIFTKLEQRGSSKQSRSVIRIGGGVALSVEEGGAKQEERRSTSQVPVNMLDSTAPVQKRGKEREIPKVKKPSALKKVILKEREEKKENRINQLTTSDVPETDIPPYPPAILQSMPAVVQDEQIENKIAQLTLENLPSTIPQIHSRRYREYCCQVLDKRIDETCTAILQKLVQFQDRLYQKDPMKAKMKRRLVMGLREVTKHLKLKKLKCVVISPNLEKIQSKGGLDDALQNILNMCEEQEVTYVFALGRKAMGRAVCKLVPVSIIGIFDYNGAEEQYKQLVELVAEAQNKYKEMVSIYQQEVNEVSSQSVQPVSTAGSKRFSHMGHSRNPSAASCVSFASFISEPISELNEASNWRVMMGADESSLSPPPEKESSSDEEDHNSRPASQELSRKGSGSTVVEGKHSGVKISSEDALKEEEDRSPSSESPPKVLNKSFASTTSTLTNLNLPTSSREASSISPSDGSSMQDRINLWLEDATRSVHDFNLSSPDTEHLPPVLEENLSEATSDTDEEEKKLIDVEKQDNDVVDSNCDVIADNEEQLIIRDVDKQDNSVVDRNCDVIIDNEKQLITSKEKTYDEKLNKDDVIISGDVDINDTPDDNEVREFNES